MLDAAKIDLSKYRLERAGEMLRTARRDLDAGDYASANNRAYYCVFHSMRAVLALTGEDYITPAIIHPQTTADPVLPE